MEQDIRHGDADECARRRGIPGGRHAERTAINRYVGVCSGLTPRDAFEAHTFNDGSEVTGTVVDTTADAVVMNDYRTGRTGVKTPVGSSLRDKLTFTRSDVATVSVLKVPTRYDAGGAPNVAVVRHVVTALGIGKKIDLKTTRSMQSRRGTIRSIEQDGFRVVQGFRAPADFVAYSDVDQVKAAGMHGFLKRAILIPTGYCLVFVILMSLADWS